MNDIQSAMSAHAKAVRLEEELAALPQVDCPVVSHYAPGVYMREMTIPAGVTLVGATHKHEHLSVLAKGHLIVTTDDGVAEFHAPAVVLQKPGHKRAGYAVTECVFINVHHNPDDERDLAVLCERYTDAKYDELMGGPNNKQLLRSGAAKELE